MCLIINYFIKYRDLQQREPVIHNEKLHWEAAITVFAKPTQCFLSAPGFCRCIVMHKNTRTVVSGLIH